MVFSSRAKSQGKEESNLFISAILLPLLNRYHLTILAIKKWDGKIKSNTIAKFYKKKIFLNVFLNEYCRNRLLFASLLFFFFS